MAKVARHQSTTMNVCETDLKSHLLELILSQKKFQDYILPYFLSMDRVCLDDDCLCVPRPEKQREDRGE